jgi:hypothetical protein
VRGGGGGVAIVSVRMSVHVSPLTASSHEPENLIRFRMQQGVFVVALVGSGKHEMQGVKHPTAEEEDPSN